MNTQTEKTFQPQDRVVVTDLRTGESHEGEVVAVLGDMLEVRYDRGGTYRVGSGFVRKIG